MADETLRGVELTHRYADLGDVRLHYVEAGEGPPVVLLHGFPQFWYEWRHQIPALVEAGFRVVAPDMRGYNLSDKPPGVRSYRVELPARVPDVLLSPGQLLRSSYVLFFQLPGLPEEVIRAGDFALLRSALRRDPVRAGAFTAEDIERYVGAMKRPGAP